MTENDWRAARTSPTGREKTEILWSAFLERLASRLLAICFAPFYLSLCAAGWAAAARVSLAESLVLTGVSALAIMVVITLLAEKFYIYRRTGVRFSLSTAFMMTIPFCIYLAAIQKVLLRIPAGADPVTWVFVAVIAIGWMCLTTVVLMWLAEALMYLAVWWQRWWLVVYRSEDRPVEASEAIESWSTSRETTDGCTVKSTVKSTVKTMVKTMVNDDSRMGDDGASSQIRRTDQTP